MEVDHTADTHRMYRELVSGGSGYGARRWIVTLERMCERMALSTILIMPATDWSESMFQVFLTLLIIYISSYNQYFNL